MSKYSTELKIKVVKAYFNGEIFRTQKTRDKYF